MTRTPTVTRTPTSTATVTRTRDAVIHATADKHTDGNPFANADANPVLHEDAVPHAHSVTDADAVADSDRDPDAFEHVNADAHSHTDETRTPTPTHPPSIGPIVTYFGLTTADNWVLTPDDTDAQGHPVFTRPSGFGFFIVIEAKAGTSGRCPQPMFQNSNPSDPTAAGHPDRGESVVGNGCGPGQPGHL